MKGYERSRQERALLACEWCEWCGWCGMVLRVGWVVEQDQLWLALHI